jgi:hypothetical protein
MTCAVSSYWVGFVGLLCGVATAEAGEAEAGPTLAERMLMVPTAAVALGPSWPVSPGGGPGLLVDVTVGAGIGWPPHVAGMPEARFLKSTLWLLPEFGYTYRQPYKLSTDPREGGHLGSVGLGVGYGSLLFVQIAYTPRLVLGSVGDELAVGLRHGVQAYFLGRLFSLEIAHQLLSVAGEVRHEMRMALGLNFASLLHNY